MLALKRVRRANALRGKHSKLQWCSPACGKAPLEPRTNVTAARTEEKKTEKLVHTPTVSNRRRHCFLLRVLFGGIVAKNNPMQMNKKKMMGSEGWKIHS